MSQLVTQKVWLASKSPRRQELLAQMGIEFSTMTAPCDERPKQGETPRQLVMRLAKEKAQAVLDLDEVAANDWVIAGDTLLELAGQSIGKPLDKEDARRILYKLSGQTHSVLSAIALAHNGSLEVAVNETQVTFVALNDDEIERYLRSDEPYDKAGAYAIQGEAAKWISQMSGSYYAVMGLPIFELNQLLTKMGFYTQSKNEFKTSAPNG